MCVRNGCAIATLITIMKCAGGFYWSSRASAWQTDTNDIEKSGELLHYKDVKAALERFKATESEPSRAALTLCAHKDELQVDAVSIKAVLTSAVGLHAVNIDPTTDGGYRMIKSLSKPGLVAKIKNKIPCLSTKIGASLLSIRCVASPTTPTYYAWTKRCLEA